MLDTTSPVTISNYLTANGWAQEGTYANSTVWTLQGYEVLVPTSASLRDYDRRVVELQATIKEVMA